MQREQVLAFRAERHGLRERDARPLSDAAACPASDFQPGSALVAIAARKRDVTREHYEQARARRWARWPIWSTNIEQPSHPCSWFGPNMKW